MLAVGSAGRAVSPEAVRGPLSLVALEPPILVAPVQAVTTVEIPIALPITITVQQTVTVAVAVAVTVTLSLSLSVPIIPVAIPFSVPIPIPIPLPIAVHGTVTVAVSVSVSVSVTIPITIPPAVAGPTAAPEGVSIVQVGSSSATPSSFPVATAATAARCGTRVMAYAGRTVEARGRGGEQAVTGVSSQSSHIDVASSRFSRVSKVSGRVSCCRRSRARTTKPDAGVSGVEIAVSPAPVAIRIAAEGGPVPEVAVAVSLSIPVAIPVAIPVSEVATGRIAPASGSKRAASGRVDQGLGAAGGLSAQGRRVGIVGAAGARGEVDGGSTVAETVGGAVAGGEPGRRREAGRHQGLMLDSRPAALRRGSVTLGRVGRAHT